MLLLERKWCGKDGIGAEVIDRDRDELVDLWCEQNVAEYV